MKKLCILLKYRQKLREKVSYKKGLSFLKKKKKSQRHLKNYGLYRNTTFKKSYNLLGFPDLYILQNTSQQCTTLDAKECVEKDRGKLEDRNA